MPRFGIRLVDLSKGEQMSLFGGSSGGGGKTTTVKVKAHTRRTKNGKLVQVPAHVAERPTSSVNMEMRRRGMTDGIARASKVSGVVENALQEAKNTASIRSNAELRSMLLKRAKDVVALYDDVVPTSRPGPIRSFQDATEHDGITLAGALHEFNDLGVWAANGAGVGRGDVYMHHIRKNRDDKGGAGGDGVGLADSLRSLGFKEWKGGNGQRRIYIDDPMQFAGWSVRRHGSGNLSEVKDRSGSRLSNSKASELASVRAYLDLETGSMVYQGSARAKDDLVRDIKARIAELEPPASRGPQGGEDPVDEEGGELVPLYRRLIRDADSVGDTMDYQRKVAAAPMPTNPTEEMMYRHLRDRAFYTGRSTLVEAAMDKASRSHGLNQWHEIGRNHNGDLYALKVKRTADEHNPFAVLVRESTPDGTDTVVRYGRTLAQSREHPTGPSFSQIMETSKVVSEALSHFDGFHKKGAPSGFSVVTSE